MPPRAEQPMESFADPLLGTTLGEERTEAPREVVHTQWRSEAMILYQVAWPVALSSFCRLIMAVTDVAVLGRLENGTDYLAAASLAFVWMDITLTFPWAANDALNSLCAQAAGAKNFPLVGKWLQIGLAMTSIMSVPVLISWLFTAEILEAIGCDPRLSAMAETFALYSAIGAVPNCFYYAIRQYFQAQKIVLPALYNNLAFVLVNFILNIALVHGVTLGPWVVIPPLGLIGSALATAISRTLQLLVFVVIVMWWMRLHEPTWPKDGWYGWSFSTFSKTRIKEFLSQAIPTMFGDAAEQMEVVTLMAAHLGEVSMATQSAIFNVFFTLHCFAFGLARATSVRVGFHLGANRPREAKLIARISAIMALTIGVAVAAILIIVHSYLGHIYSKDPAVWAESSKIAWVIGAGYIFVSMLISMTAVLLGQGRPGPIAILGFICSWLVSLPVAYLMAFKAKRGLSGLWYGIDIGYMAYAGLCGLLVYRSRWAHLALDAMLRSEAETAAIVEEGESASLLQAQIPDTKATSQRPLQRGSESPSAIRIISDAATRSPRISRG